MAYANGPFGKQRRDSSSGWEYGRKRLALGRVVERNASFNILGQILLGCQEHGIEISSLKKKLAVYYLGDTGLRSQRRKDNKDYPRYDSIRTSSGFYDALVQDNALPSGAGKLPLSSEGISLRVKDAAIDVATNRHTEMGSTRLYLSVSSHPQVVHELLEVRTRLEPVADHDREVVQTTHDVDVGHTQLPVLPEELAAINGRLVIPHVIELGEFRVYDAGVIRNMRG